VLNVLSDVDSIHSFGDVYNGLRLNTSLHCTSFFAGYKNKNVAVVNYAHCESVSRSMGLVFTLMITGIFFTPRSAGLRVSLTDDQIALFNEKEDEVGDRFTSKSSPAGNFLDVGDKKRKRDKRNCRSTIEKGVNFMGKNDDFPDATTDTDSGMCNRKEFLHASSLKADKSELCAMTVDPGKGHKAHITLGYSNTSHAALAGKELFDIIACESTGSADEITLDDQASISYYGKGRCMVMFHQPILINSLFSGRF